MTTPRQPLTPRQRQVLAIITAHLLEHGYPPTLREICRQLGTSSTNGAHDHLVTLERKGWIRVARSSSSSGRVSRGITVLGLATTELASPANVDPAHLWVWLVCTDCEHASQISMRAGSDHPSVGKPCLCGGKRVLLRDLQRRARLGTLEVVER